MDVHMDGAILYLHSGGIRHSPGLAALRTSVSGLCEIENEFHPPRRGADDVARVGCPGSLPTAVSPVRPAGTPRRAPRDLLGRTRYLVAIGNLYSDFIHRPPNPLTRSLRLPLIHQLAMPRAIISPSVLASDFGQLTAECKRMIKGGAEWLHMGALQTARPCTTTRD